MLQLGFPLHLVNDDFLLLCLTGTLCKRLSQGVDGAGEYGAFVMIPCPLLWWLTGNMTQRP